MISTLTHPLQHSSGNNRDTPWKIAKALSALQAFANDIDGLARDEEELAKLIRRLDKASTVYGMGISAEKTKLMTNDSGINKEIKINGQKLETVTSCKYLGSVVSDEGRKPEIFFRIAQTTAALTRLKPVLNVRNIFLNPKIRLMRCPVTSIFLCACESWTLIAEQQKQKKKERKEYEPRKGGATARYYTSHTKTTLPTRKSVPRSRKQSDYTKTS